MTDPCPSTLPTIASYKYDGGHGQQWPARAALVDYVTEGYLPGEPGVFNIWAGTGQQGRDEPGFVIDLGCMKTITKIEMRNTANSYNYG